MGPDSAITPEARLAAAKDQDDACQAELRDARAAAAAAKNELKEALRGWRRNR